MPYKALTCHVTQGVQAVGEQKSRLNLHAKVTLGALVCFYMPLYTHHMPDHSGA